jgi:putative inorganic carbon (HCO3(-)) transporter
MTRWLLMLLLMTLMAVFIIGDAANTGVIGLSPKNAVLYAAGISLVIRNVVDRRGIIDLGGIQLCFLLLVGYGTFTWLVRSLWLPFPRYDMLESGITLKTLLIEHLTFFLVFFYGVKDAAEAGQALKGLLLVVVVANVVTLVDASGLATIGQIEIGEDGRVQGAIGEQNQYAAFVVLFNPALVAMARASTGWRRNAWWAAAILSVVALILTVSRGGFISTILSTVIGCWLFRKYLPRLRVGRIIGAIAILLLVVAVVASTQYGQLLQERVLRQSFSGNSFDASSGRTETWTRMFQDMVAQPITFITGFGWNVYSYLGRPYISHNHYLGEWYELGLIGVGSYIYIFVRSVRYALQAAAVAEEQMRPHLIAFGFGIMGLAIAINFVNLFQAWAYVWAYAGLALRIAVEVINKRQSAAPGVTGKPSNAARAPQQDAYGWSR